VSLPVFLCACLEQFDRSKFNNQYHADRALTSGPQMKLTAAGEIPSGEAAVVPIDQVFANYCSTCHGTAGKGDGPAGAALNPHPRNFTDANWQAATSDDRIFNVIKNGGAANGLSAVMAPWGSVLTDDQIKQMVAHVRKFKG
jgi:mono/diheme cytochrome c family protein